MTDKTYHDLIPTIIEREGATLPDGFDSWGIKSVRPDLRTYGGYQWPFPGSVAVADSVDDANTDSCPAREGDGLCVGLSWRGMASGGIPARTLLLVAYRSAEVLGVATSEGKLRCRSVAVVAVVDGERLLREAGADAYLRGAYLAGADLTGANLRGANLRGADLRCADLRCADLRDAYLRGADLTGANLTGAYLAGASLAGAYLTGTDLAGANLTGASLTGAYLAGASLAGADLAGADLTGAYLAGANLTDANLTGADLTAANLTGADLTAANLTDANLTAAYASQYTHWPRGFDPAGQGMTVR